MSAIIGLVVAAIVTGVLIPKGAKLVSKTLEKVSGQFGPNSRSLTAPDSIGAGTSNALVKPVNKIQTDFKSLFDKVSDMTNVERAKKAILDDIASQPFYTADTHDIENKIAALKNSSTIEDVVVTGQDLADFITADHQKLVSSGVKIACQQAAVKIGFSKIEALSSPLTSNVIRFAASDDIGRTIVTEIDTRAHRDMRIDAEVLGVNDNSCHRILDEFHTALKAEGIDLGAKPKREGTGGVCTLAAAKMFLQTKFTPERKAVAASRVVEPRGKEGMRHRRLNQKQKVNVTS